MHVACAVRRGRNTLHFHHIFATNHLPPARSRSRRSSLSLGLDARARPASDEVLRLAPHHLHRRRALRLTRIRVHKGHDSVNCVAREGRVVVPCAQEVRVRDRDEEGVEEEWDAEDGACENNELKTRNDDHGDIVVGCGSVRKVSTMLVYQNLRPDLPFTQVPMVFAMGDCVDAGAAVPFARGAGGGALMTSGSTVVRTKVNAWNKENTA